MNEPDGDNFNEEIFLKIIGHGRVEEKKSQETIALCLKVFFQSVFL